MRALTWHITTCGLLAVCALTAPPLLGVTQEAYTLVSGVSGRGSAAAESLGIGPAGERRKGSVGYRVSGIAQVLTLSAALGAETLNADTFIVRDRQGRERPLVDDAQATTRTAEARALLQKGPASFAVGGAKTLDDNPLATTQADAVLRYGFFEQTTTLAAAYAYLEQQQPESYFVDRDYKTKRRPTAVHAAQTTLGVEQVLSSRLKAEAQMLAGQRREERPVYAGGALAGTYAFSDRLFTRAEARLLQERRGEPLQNERGYFTLRAAKAEITAEPLYDWLLSASLGLVREDENDPRVAASSRLVSRVYGLGTRLTAGAAQVDLRSAYQTSGAGDTRVAFDGGLTWKL